MPKKEKNPDQNFVNFDKNVIILGFGSIAQAALPLLFRHIGLQPDQVKIISRSPDKTGIAKEYGVTFVAQPLKADNFEAVLQEYLQPGDFLLNLSVDVSSLELIRYCWRNDILYLDTCIEPWPGRYDNASLSPSQRSNYALREELLAFRLDKRNGPTAVVTQGANPGLASVMVKQALLNIANDTDTDVGPLNCYEDWAKLAQKLNIKVIHIAERDTQISLQRKQKDEFINTWSIEGFVSEGMQPAEMGWGSHELHWPSDAERHGYGCDAAVFLQRPGITTRVRSWTPLEGPYYGFLVTHGESISIADHLTVRDSNKAEVTYRPTVHYAYHPCDDAVLSLHEMSGKGGQLQHNKRIMRDEITEGMDELGVLLMGNPKGVYWFGSRLTIDQARQLAPHNTATSLQVVAGILGGMVWAILHQDAGVVEPDDLDHALIMEIASPYLGELAGEYGEWTPLKNRTDLFEEESDTDDPWQFINFRVH